MAEPRPGRDPLVVWRLLDGKPGHENQTLGLANALARQVPAQIHALPASGGWRAWRELLLGRCRAGAGLPAPHLLLGAGHGTHAALLACRRACGGRAVALMRPSLPAAWFDLCLVPAHDGVAAGGTVQLTRGVLNAVVPAPPDAARPGLVLIGGPSRHHGWDQAALLEQLRAILAREDRPWLLATSRRTPAATEKALAGLVREGVTLVSWRDAAPGWLAGQLPGTPAAWVSADSVSMVYEALTAGAACGVLPVPLIRPGRVSAGLQSLIDEGSVTGFARWRDGAALAPPPQPFDEATRCARLVLDRWFAR